MVVVGRVPTGTPSCCYLPLSVAVVLVFATAIGLLLAAINVYLRDVQYLVEIVPDAPVLGFADRLLVATGPRQPRRHLDWRRST